MYSIIQQNFLLKLRKEKETEIYLNNLIRQEELVKKLLSVIEELKNLKEKRSFKIEFLKKTLASKNEKYGWDGFLIFNFYQKYLTKLIKKQKK
jgi:hypothetical protein